MANGHTVLVLGGLGVGVALIAMAVKSKAKAQPQGAQPPRDDAAGILQDAHAALADLPPSFTADRL
jgi:hypothetical protein